MEKQKKLNILGTLLLFSATVAWGTSFFILKQAIAKAPAFYIIAIRFLSAGIILALVFIKKFKKFNKATLIRGVVLGFVLAMAYLIQTEGLKYTTPSRSAFLTASYCVMCPFLMWLMYKNRPKNYHVISAVLCIAGIGLIALSGGGEETGTNLLLGDGLTLIAAVFFGLQIIFIERSQNKGDDSYLLLVIELLSTGLIIGIASLVLELPVYGITAYAIGSDVLVDIIYLTLVCTLFAQLALIVGQKFTTVNQAAIILSLEAVFGTLFSVILGNEQLSAWLIVGFVMVFLAMIISETKLDVFALLKKRLQKSEKNTDEKNENTIDKT